ncbi:MAG: hypothetical protein P4L20_15225 [Acidimicrobiales bacterium]|nr:hypothetical protein [Acidimicrobiales bacterium]
MEDRADSQTSPSEAGASPTQAPPATAPATAATAPGLGTTGVSEAEWPAKVADTIEEVVGSVHDRVVRPLTLVARGVVFGIIIAVMALVLSVLMVIAVIRLLDVYAFGGRVWASDALLGALMVAGGAFAWTKRGARSAEEN